jgi:hypothetical protein
MSWSVPIEVAAPPVDLPKVPVIVVLPGWL